MTTSAVVPAVCREAGGQDVLDPLRVGVPRGEVVLVAGAHDLGHRRQGDDPEDPQTEHPPPVVVAPAGQPAQETLLGRRPGPACCRRRRDPPTVGSVP